MSYRTGIFVWAVLACVAARGAAPSPGGAELPDDDWQADAASPGVGTNAVPVVPLPPAFYGSASVVGVLALTRVNRLRKWLTLR